MIAKSRQSGDAGKLAEICGPVDIVATQFSYASKQGDIGKDWIDDARSYHLERLNIKLANLEAEYVLPFASFVYWSHQENCYLNEGVIRVDEAAGEIEKNGQRPIVMYPGDQWEVGADWDNSRALSSYNERYCWLEKSPAETFARSESVSPEALVSTAQTFLEKLSAGSSIGRLQKFLALKHADIRDRESPPSLGRKIRRLSSGLRVQVEPVTIFVDDHNQAYEFTIGDGLRPANYERDDCHISISSAALNFGFSVGFGGESLQVNGRFQNIHPDGWRFISTIFFLARRIEQGFRIPKFVVTSAVAGSFGIHLD